jgi:hypothetical protein
MEEGGETTALGGEEKGRREKAKSLPPPWKEPHKSSEVFS